MSDSTISTVMQESAGIACQFAEGFSHVVLDYSESSLDHVEQILAKLHDDLPKGFFAKLFRRSPSRQTIDKMCLIFGAYIGEVIRRRWNGEWIEKHPLQPGLPALVVANQTLAPTSKVFKRIVDGPGDNIVFYYQALCQMLQKPEMPSTDK